jgi:hypothetical protein
MRIVACALGLLVSLAAVSTSSALVPKLIFHANVGDCGTMSFEVGYRHGKPFLLEGTMVLKGVEYKLVETGQDLADGVQFKILAKGASKDATPIGAGLARLHPRLQVTGAVEVGKEKYNLFSREKVGPSYC